MGPYSAGIGYSQRGKLTVKYIEEGLSSQLGYTLEDGILPEDIVYKLEPALEVMETEATWGDLEQFAGALEGLEGVCPGERFGDAGAPHELLDRVAPKEAAFFCEQLGMRLPTFQEWEAIARGDQGRLYGFSDAIEGREPALSAKPGPKPHDWNKTPEGVYNMSAGVAEWVTCAGIPAEVCPLKFVHRGGSWRSEPPFWHTFTSVSPRDCPDEDCSCYREDFVGFRCVMDASAP